jgi:hypothetical protein
MIQFLTEPAEEQDYHWNRKPSSRAGTRSEVNSQSLLLAVVCNGRRRFNAQRPIVSEYDEKAAPELKRAFHDAYSSIVAVSFLSVFPPASTS